MKVICDEKFCTGCAACVNICPVKAIRMDENVVGHILPAIDENRCIDCKLCPRICPLRNSSIVFNTPMRAYASWAKDKLEHDSSTSGGIAATLSRYYVENGGVVYGCVCNPKGKIEHERVDTVEALNKLKGSKYVQSHMGTVYQSLKQDLNDGNEVLFVGTPCQVAGLKSFLKQPYKNLFTIDLICHGVPSQKMLFEHLKTHKINREEIVSVSFREPEGFFLSVVSEDGIIYRKIDLQDIYYAAFLDGLTFRESCVNCQYAQPKRISDLTIGDFHGLGKIVPFQERMEGLVSVVLVNTTEGSKLINKCQGQLVLHERTIGEAVAGNSQLKSPFIRRANYDRFKKLYLKYGFDKAAKRSLRIRRIKNMILHYIWKCRG